MEVNTSAVPAVIDEIKAIFKTAWGLFTEHKAINAGFFILLMALFCIPLKIEVTPVCSPDEVDHLHNALVIGKLIYYLVITSGLTIALPHLVLAFLYCQVINLLKVITIVFLTYAVIFFSATSMVIPFS